VYKAGGCGLTQVSSVYQLAGLRSPSVAPVGQLESRGVHRPTSNLGDGALISEAQHAPSP